jgi:ribonuclease PH
MVNKLLKDGIFEKNPIIEPIGAISAGIVNNEVMVDLCYEEDSSAQVDSNIVLTNSGKIIEFQTTAEGAPFEKSQLDEIYNLANNAIQKIISMYN